jgi:hypothetical protein
MSQNTATLAVTLAVLALIAVIGNFGFGWLDRWRQAQARARELRSQAWREGDHEACWLTDEEEVWWHHIKARYPNLGKGVRP